MKNVYVLLFCCCLFLSCTDDTQEATLDTTSTAPFASRPEADPTHDNSYKGIYKGIITGNISGALYVNLFNDNQITAKLKTNDDHTYVLENVSSSESEIDHVIYKRFRFSNENIDLEIKLDENGNNVSVSHFMFDSDSDSKACLMKEKSTSLIKCYTGRFKGNTEDGIVNFTTDGQLKIAGLSRETTSSSYNEVTGEIKVIDPLDGIGEVENLTKPNTHYQLDANLHIGYISGDLDRYRFDGFWNNGDERIGIWNAERIL